MRRTFGLLLAGGLALMVAGCASTHENTAPAAAARPGAASSAGQVTASNGDVSRVNHNFNLRVKCPGIHEEKTHGWSDQQIMAQESVDQEDIPACMAWVETQPKGFVPPPPPGFVPKKTTVPVGPGAHPAPAAAASPAAGAAH